MLPRSISIIIRIKKQETRPGVVFLTFIFFSLGGPFERLLGKTGINVITRLMGMLLAALSVQFVVDGLNGLGVI